MEVNDKFKFKKKYGVRIIVFVIRLLYSFRIIVFVSNYCIRYRIIVFVTGLLYAAVEIKKERVL